MESQNGLGGRDLTDHPAPTPTMGRAAPHQLRLPRAPSNLALNASRDGAPTDSLGSPLCLLKGHDEVCLEPTLLQVLQPQISQPYCMGENEHECGL